jgi:hypothetical protein
MPRKSKTAVEDGYMRSFWAEVVEIEREYNAVVTVVLYATNQRGVFTVELRALEMAVMQNNEPVSHSITKRLPDGGSLPFVGALWDCSRKLNDMVTQSVQFRQAAQ